MKVKTAELDGLALDWAVAVARNMPDIKIFGPVRHNDRGWIEVRFNPDHRAIPTGRYDPSINPEFSWPIIELEGITLRCGLHGWDAELEEFDAISHGPTPLIAACRCVVTSRLGDEVDVPDELV